MLTRAALRAFSTDGLKVINDVAKQQFVVRVQTDEAVLGYSKSGDEITFLHTNVPEVFQGKGVGKILAKSAFDYAKNNDLNVTCQCHFLANFYEKHKKDYKGLNIEFNLENQN